MQNCYTGDIGDYVKYALLRVLTHGQSLGVAWYLYPAEDNSDGQHVDYLNRPKEWRRYDCELFDKLYNIVNGDGKRSVSAIEESGILGTAVFSGKVLEPSKSREWRLNWFKDVQSKLKNCNIIFADPDNSLREDEKFDEGDNWSEWKRIPLREAKDLANGRTAIIYHHHGRPKGGIPLEINYWKEKLGVDTLALRWRPWGNRTFFIINPTVDMGRRLKKFEEKWGTLKKYHDGWKPQVEIC